MSRFEDVTSDVYEIMNKLIGEKFPYLNGCVIKAFFDTKKRKSDGKYVFGRLQSTNDLTKYLSIDNENPEGADFFMYIDKNVWGKIEEIDKKRLIYHELCHAGCDLDKKTPYFIQDHEIQMFESEIEANKDEPRWGLKLASIAESIYETEN